MENALTNAASQSNFTGLDWGIVVVYLLLSVGVAFFVKRYAGNMTNFVGAGRAVGPWLGIATLTGTEMGLITVMYSAQKGFTGGFAAFHIGIIAGVVAFIIGVTGFIIVRLREHKVLTISYPWQGFGDPDSTNDRLDTVVAYLEEERPDIEYVWWDFMCVPQATNIPDRATGEVEHQYPTTYKKNVFDDLYFTTMINKGGVNLIYLGAHVLSIANALYIQRFWTQFEAWLAMQQTTDAGLSSAVGLPPADRRYEVMGVLNARDMTNQQLEMIEKMWGTATPEEAHDKLKRDDVTVTNQKDKEFFLPMIKDAYRHLGTLGEIAFRRFSSSADQELSLIHI